MGYVDADLDCGSDSTIERCPCCVVAIDSPLSSNDVQFAVKRFQLGSNARYWNSANWVCELGVGVGLGIPCAHPLDPCEYPLSFDVARNKFRGVPFPSNVELVYGS